MVVTFCQESRVFSRGNPEFVVKAVMPNFFHVIPIVDDSVFNGVIQFEDSFFGLGLFSDV